jgi:multiple antibiotic resistance protein
MSPWNEYLAMLTGLTAVVDPLGAIPVYLSLSQHRSRVQSRNNAFLCAGSVIVVLLTALVSGDAVLKLFGIGLPAFRVAGGILILTMGLNMLQASYDRSRQTPEEHEESAEKDSIAVVPMAIPMLSGPGAISTIIVYGNADPSLGHLLLVGAVILSVAVLVLIALLLAEPISAAMSRTSMNVITRVMGMIILSIAVEFIASGLNQLFPVLGKVSQ